MAIAARLPARMIGSHRPHLILGTSGPLGLCRCRIPLTAFDTHLYVVGRTKQGKSKFLQSLAAQLILQGQGCGILDPHSDLCDDLLTQLQPQLARDAALRARILYLQPGRDDYGVPFNVLRTPGEPYAVAQGLIEAFRRTWAGSLAEAPRFDNIVLAALLLLIEQSLTLIDLPRLLTERDYRERLLASSRNGEVVRFFHERFDRWGRERALVIESTLNKVGAFVLNPRLRRMLGQGENGLPFREILDGRKVLLCDLGKVDDETRRLLGNLIVTGLEGAAMGRVDTPQRARAPFYLMIDEFQDYTAREGSARTLARILGECRKFGLHLGLAHQSLSQIPDAALRGALENVGLRAVFGVGRETAETLVGELFAPDPTAVKHTVPDPVARERGHPAFYSLGEQWERDVQRLLRQPRRQALVQVPGARSPRQIRTLTAPDTGVSQEQLHRLERDLAEQSGRPVAEMEAAIARREQAQLALEKEPAVRYYENIEPSPHAGAAARECGRTGMGPHSPATK